MARSLNPVEIRRLLARTLRVGLDGGAPPPQLLDRWGAARAREASWRAALLWDGVGAAVGWALSELDLANLAPPDLETAAAEAYEQARAQSVQQTADLVRIGVEMEGTGVPAIALKGSALLIANLVPALGARWMSDLDLLVPEHQVEPASRVLASLDYARGGSRVGAPPLYHPYHDTFTTADGRAVELHWRLGPARWGPASSGADWFARALPSSAAGIRVPAVADLFWHFLVHDARNHAWSTGSLRAALDLALVARAPGFTLAAVVDQLRSDPRPEPLVEAIADAAHLSSVLSAALAPSPQPRYLRLAAWRDAIGRRRWRAERVSEAIAWGATLDRARRFGGWEGVLDRALTIVPEASPGRSLGARMRRALLTARHAGFVGVLAGAHLLSVPGLGGSADRARLAAPAPSPGGGGGR